MPPGTRSPSARNPISTVEKADRDGAGERDTPKPREPIDGLGLTASAGHVGPRAGGGRYGEARHGDRRREQQQNRHQVRRVAQIANDARIDPGQRSVAREFDEAVARRDADHDTHRAGGIAARQGLTRGSIAPANLVGGASRRPHVDMQRRGPTDFCLECDQVVFTRDNLRNNPRAFNVEALRGRGARRGAIALREIQAISGDVGPVTGNQQADAEGDECEDPGECVEERSQPR